MRKEVGYELNEAERYSYDMIVFSSAAVFLSIFIMLIEELCAVVHPPCSQNKSHTYPHNISRIQPYL